MSGFEEEAVPPSGAVPGERVLVDEGEDHVGTARRAYPDARTYAWLLARSPAPAP